MNVYIRLEIHVCHNRIIFMKKRKKQRPSGLYFGVGDGRGSRSCPQAPVSSSQQQKFEHNLVYEN